MRATVSLMDTCEMMIIQAKHVVIENLGMLSLLHFIIVKEEVVGIAIDVVGVR